MAMVHEFDLDQWVMGHGGSNPHCMAFMGSNMHSFHKSCWLGSLFLFGFILFYFVYFSASGGDAIVVVGCYFGGYLNRLSGGGLWVLVASYDN